MGAKYITRSDLSEWLQVILVLLAFAIAYGLLYARVTIPSARRFRRRVSAVEAAAGNDPVFGREPVRSAAVSLYRAVYEALAAGDRWRLARICDDNLLAYWGGLRRPAAVVRVHLNFPACLAQKHVRGLAAVGSGAGSGLDGDIADGMLSHSRRKEQ